jgi:hypothetical protein
VPGGWDIGCYCTDRAIILALKIVTKFRQTGNKIKTYIENDSSICDLKTDTNNLLIIYTNIEMVERL